MRPFSSWPIRHCKPCTEGSARRVRRVGSTWWLQAEWSAIVSRLHKGNHTFLSEQRILKKLTFNLLFLFQLSFMQKNCPVACHKAMHKDPVTKRIHDDQEELYELSAKTSNGKTLSMENFEGYVTVIVNTARVCGEKDTIIFTLHVTCTWRISHSFSKYLSYYWTDYTEVFYETLEHMHSIHPYSWVSLCKDFVGL